MSKKPLSLQVYHIVALFNRQARPGALFYLADNFIHLARLVRLGEKPLEVDALAEINPADEDALKRWLSTNFHDFVGRGYVPAYCGFHPAQRVLVRENLNARRFAEANYLSALVAEHAKVASTKDWQMAALHPSDGTPPVADGVIRPGLLLGIPDEEIIEQQQRLLKLGMRPRRLEVGSIALLGCLSQHLVRAGMAHAVVVCEIERSQTRTYVVAKDGVHTLPALPHGLLSILESAMNELGSPDVASARQQLEDPPEALRTHGRRLVRALSRHLKPAMDHFELRTGQRIDTFFCAQLPSRLHWLGQALSSAVELDLFSPNFESWLAASGLKVTPGEVTLTASWLPTLSLITQLAPLPNG